MENFLEKMSFFGFWQLKSQSINALTIIIVVIAYPLRSYDIQMSRFTLSDYYRDS